MDLVQMKIPVIAKLLLETCHPFHQLNGRYSGITMALESHGSKGTRPVCLRDLDHTTVVAFNQPVSRFTIVGSRRWAGSSAICTKISTIRSQASGPFRAAK